MNTANQVSKLESKFKIEQTKLIIEKERLIQEQEAKEQARIAAEAKYRRDNLQYGGSIIFIICLVLLVGFSGKLHLSQRWAGGLVFFTFLMIFELVLVYLDVYIENWSGGEPMWKLIINSGLAAIIFPIHQTFEDKLKKKLLILEKQKQSSKE